MIPSLIRPALPCYADTRWSAIAATVATAIFLPWLLLYAIDGQRILDPKVYDALDAASLDLSAYGFGIVQNSPT